MFYLNLLPNRRRLILLNVIVAAFSFSSFSFSQQNIFFSGAREAGLANTGVAYSEQWSMFHNPARLTVNTDPVIGVHYTNQFMLKELSVASITGILPVKRGAFGIAASYYGTIRYNEQQYAIGFSHRLGKTFSLGASCDYYLIQLPEEYEPEGVIAGEIGLSASATDNLTFGCHLYNVSGSKSKNYYSQNLPSYFSLGGAWQDKAFMLTSEAKLIKNEDPEISAAAEVYLVPELAIRTGASNSKMYQYTFGVGYNLKRIQCDLAFAHHPILGFSSFLSFHYTFL